MMSGHVDPKTFMRCAHHRENLDQNAVNRLSYDRGGGGAIVPDTGLNRTPVKSSDQITNLCQTIEGPWTSWQVETDYDIGSALSVLGFNPIRPFTAGPTSTVWCGMT